MQLSIVTLGHVHAEDLTALTPHFTRLEQLVLDVPPRDALSRHRAELNRAIDAATADWIFIVREREVIDDALAKEIAGVMSGVSARGFRIRSVPFYAGKPLRLSGGGRTSRPPRDGADGTSALHYGEVRLFHRRNYMRYANKGEWDEITIQGSVVRLGCPLRSVTFASPAEHREYLAKNAAAHSALRRVLLFASYLMGVRTLDANTLQYLWIEAGYDVALTP